MKRTTIKKIVRGALLATVVVTVVFGMVMFVFWDTISEAYGPMEQSESFCLVCYRNRVEKWVCGVKIQNDITSTNYSDWIDSFTSSDHKHVWAISTSQHRGDWFGNTLIGCGGIATIPRIFEQRDHLGDAKSQQLVFKYHELLRQQSPKIDIDDLARFVDVVVQNPNSLLELEKAN